MDEKMRKERPPLNDSVSDKELPMKEDMENERTSSEEDALDAIALAEEPCSIEPAPRADQSFDGQMD